VSLPTTVPGASWGAFHAHGPMSKFVDRYLEHTGQSQSPEFPAPRSKLAEMRLTAIDEVVSYPQPHGPVHRVRV
jgi:hypothetical protein